jgi:hypothetical protein
VKWLRALGLRSVRTAVHGVSALRADSEIAAEAEIADQNDDNDEDDDDDGVISARAVNASSKGNGNGNGNGNGGGGGGFRLNVWCSGVLICDIVSSLAKVGSTRGVLLRRSFLFFGFPVLFR